MLITRVSLLTGETSTMDIPVTQDQIDELVKTTYKWYHPTKLIQEAFPDLTAEQREFIMTGSTSEEWAKIMYDPDEYEVEDSGVESF